MHNYLPLRETNILKKLGNQIRLLHGWKKWLIDKHFKLYYKIIGHVSLETELMKMYLQ